MDVWRVYLLVICPLTALSLEDNVHIPRSAPCTDLTLVGQPPASGCYWCFQDKCRCMGDMADCSGNNGSLTFIPRLPGNIRRMNFSHNDLTAIEEDVFFHNVTNISLLDLSGNQLVNLSQDAFRLLTNLTHLSLINNNNLTGGFLLPVKTDNNNDSDLWRGMALSSVCNVTTLVELDIVTLSVRPQFNADSFSDLASLQEDSEDDSLECLRRLSGLRRLHLAAVLKRECVAFHYPLIVPSGVEHLKLSAITYNGQPMKMYMYSIPPNTTVNIQTLELINILPSNWDIACQPDARFLSSLSYLSIRANYRFFVDPLCRFPKLQTLVYANLLISETILFNSSQFPELKELRLEDVQGYKFVSDWRGTSRHRPGNIWDILWDNPKLQTLSLENGDIELIKTNTGRNASDVFGGCPNLVFLSFRGSNLNKVTDEIFVELFAGLTNLRYVDLTGCQIDNTTLDRTVFAFQHVETLSMAGNNVTSIPDGLVDNMANLTHLDLHGNQIWLVSETTFSAHTRGRLRSLDLSANPFLCSCQLLWFRDWLKSHPALFARSHSVYTCSNLPNTFLVDYDPQNQSCVTHYVMPRFLLVIIIVTAVMASVTTVTAVLMYRNRTYIHRSCGLYGEYMQRVFHRMRRALRRALRRRERYMNQLRHHDLQLREQRAQGDNFRYDIFVCYAAEDMDWVRGHLLPEMEGNRGLRLCDHERDFIPGKNIVNNVVDCVESSKKVLMLFSPNFAQSQWCQFELNLCLRHVMDLQDGLVIVLLEAIPPEELTPAMKAVLYTTTYVEWEEEEVARPGVKH